MFTAYTLHSRFNKQYRIMLPGSMSLPAAGEPLRFRDSALALQFLHNLNAPVNFWQNALHSALGHTAKHQNEAAVYKNVAFLLQTGRIRVVELPKSPSQHTPQKHSFEDAHQNKIQLIPAAQLFGQGREASRPAINMREAFKVLHSLQTDDQALRSIAKNLGANANVLADAEKTKVAIVQAMCSGALAVVVQRQNQTTLKQSEAAQPAAQPKQKTMGPHTGATSSQAQVAPPQTSTTQPAQANKASSPQANTDTATPLRDDKASAEALTRASEEGASLCEECEAA